jgi:branched-chain amino acid transport system ATP-binding protein
VERIIDFLEIEHIRKVPVGRLPYGLQKRVELGRALAMEPELLLLDEPMAGMNLEEKEDMSRYILDVNDQFGTTIALIEHDMGVVRRRSREPMCAMDSKISTWTKTA